MAKFKKVPTVTADTQTKARKINLIKNDANLFHRSHTNNKTIPDKERPPKFPQ